MLERQTYEQVNIFEAMHEPYKITKPIRLIELFAGIGSQAQALKNIGADYEHHRIVEFDKYPLASYNAIHSTDFPVLDITHITGADLGITDTKTYEYLLTYSFPCQDLSPAGGGAGMEKESGTRSSLLWEVERLLKECKQLGALPQILLMENVPQVHNKKNIKAFNNWIKELENLGYSNYWQDLNAKNYGIPQTRNRCYMVSILGNWYYEFPKPKKLKLKLKDMLEDEVDEKYFIGSLNTNFTVGKLENKLPDKNDVCRTLMARDYKDPKVVIVEKQYSDISLKKIQENITDINGTSKTITASPQRATIDSATLIQKKFSNGTLRIRKLTPRECWRLMGFTDDDFNKAQELNSNTQLYKQAGNSIVVQVLEEIFKKLF